MASSVYHSQHTWYTSGMHKATTIRLTTIDRDLIRRLQIKTTIACADQPDFRPPSSADVIRMGLRLLAAAETKEDGADALRWAHMVTREDADGGDQ